MSRQEICWALLFAALAALTLAPVIERAKHGIVLIDTMQRGTK